jgi:hypothetical protein
MIAIDGHSFSHMAVSLFFPNLQSSPHLALSPIGAAFSPHGVVTADLKYSDTQPPHSDIPSLSSSTRLTYNIDIYHPSGHISASIYMDELTSNSTEEKNTEQGSGMKRAHYDIIDNRVGGPPSTSQDTADHVTSTFNSDAGRKITRVVNVSKKVHACNSLLKNPNVILQGTRLK